MESKVLVGYSFQITERPWKLRENQRGRCAIRFAGDVVNR